MQRERLRVDVAIVGVGCRLPGGVDNLDALWRVLAGGVDTMGAPPPGRPGGISGPGGFLADIDRFDADFFGVSPREAREMDPQQRLLLEVAWAAMEHAGVPRDRWAGSRTGVYLGILAMDYAILHARTLGVDGVDSYYASGKEFSFGAGRVAYTFGLHGPCVMLTAACASSLLAVHLAARALATGECDAALAGGVNLLVAPDLDVYMRQIQALSPRGQCRPFDASADGVVRGEGCGIVVLKRYEDAIADGDRIWAVIRGSAANHDGRSAGLTAPNALAQERLLCEALAGAGVAASDVSYVEAHSTGTPLGDPIELSALAAAIGRSRPPGDRPLLLGSHKANFGHLDSAAGILGLLKALLVLHHGVVPPQIKLARPTPRFDWAGSGLAVPTAPTPLGSPVVGVSAFGLSGSNVHVVLSAAPATVDSSPPATDVVDPVLVVSGPTAAALRSQVEAYDRVLATEPAADVMFSAAVRRTHHAYRVAAGVDAPAAAAEDLELVHVFSGQGAQWSGMGLDLHRTAPVVRDTLDECDALVRDLAGWSLLAELAGERLTATEYAQPAIFALQLALSRLWSSWGATPTAVVGHSVGEVAAACVAGAIGLADAIRLVLHRGRLMQEATGSGRMAAVELAAAEVASLLGPDVCVAAVNGPRSVVIAGPAPGVDAAVAALRGRGATCLPLPVDYAFHSPAVRGHGDALERLLDGLVAAPPVIPWRSSVDPDADPPVTDAAYWGRNVRDPVLFWPAVDRLLARRPAVFVELGPHPVLTRPLAAACVHRGRPRAVTGSLSRDRPARVTLAKALATLYRAGVDLDWSTVYGGRRRYVPLPAVPLAGERFWLPAPAPKLARVDHGQPRDTAADRPARPPTVNAEGDGRERVAATVTRAAAEALGHPPDRRLPRLRGFFDLGMDSLTLVEFVARLERELGCALGAGAGIEHPTIEALTDHIVGRLPAAAAAPRAAAAPAPRAAAEPIAIIGMGCRLPRADGLDGFWRLLRDGVDATSDVPADRWDAAALLGDGLTPGTVVTRRGAFLDRIDLFDHGFFRVSAREARAMDPQQRILAEVAWEALEDAGLDAEALCGGPTGVFVGMNTTDYQQILTRYRENVDLYYGTGNSFSGAPGRLSYFLGTRGPSVAIDTACSSSLVAVHLACQSLRTGESDVALAGGVNVMSTPTVYLAMSAGGALAPDGRCKTFDASADGYGRGEGAGVVVLKPLARALADGDRVYAVIRGSAVNHNGASGGLTVPSMRAQEDLIRDSVRAAGLAPADVDYLEAHGTGTRLGDAAELVAAARALGADRPADRPLLVGSVKTNVGHLEAAAGVAGLIKTALALHHGEIPPHLHVSRPTDQVAWDRLPLRVTAGRTEWPRPAGRPPVAGVSAFGFTGTNAHVTLAGVAQERVGETGVRPVRAHLLAVSAASGTALLAAGERLRDRLAALDPADIADACATAGARRTHLEYRAAVVGRTRDELVEGLAAPRWAGTAPHPRRPVLVYGDGADLPWERLDRDEPAFRATLHDVDRTAAGRCRAALAAGGLAAGDPLAIVAAQIALTAAWRDHGITPAAVAGYGLGEIAAAHAAGVLDHEGAVRAAGLPAVVTRPGGPPAIPLRLSSEAGDLARLAAGLAADGLDLLVAIDGGDAAHALAGHALAGHAPLTVVDCGGSTLGAVAALYVHGCPVDWRRLFGARPYRVALPTYPWQRRRHWVDTPGDTTTVALHRGQDPRRRVAAVDTPGDTTTVALPAAVRERVARRFFEVAWHPVDVPATDGDPPGRWLVCPLEAGAEATADRLAAALRAAGADVVSGPPPDGARTGGGHAGTLLVSGSTVDSAAALLHAAQVARAAGGTRLWVVTAGAQAPTGAAGPRVVCALGRALALEAAEIWGGLIDVAAAGDTAPVIHRLLRAGGIEDELCRRGDAWYAPRLARAGDAVPATLPALMCHPERWYLVTGGLTDAARPFVDTLVARGARRLLVTPGGTRAREAELRDAGVEIRPLPEQFAEPIGGVVLVAPPVAIRPMEVLGPADIEAAIRWAELAARVDALTRSHPLDFFCVTGSAAAAWGAAGTLAGAAVAGFVDALAADRTSAGRPVQILRVMPRGDTGELSRRDRMLMEDSGLRPLLAEDVAEAFEVAVCSGLRDVSVADADEVVYARTCNARSRRGLLDHLAAGAGPGPAPALVEQLRAAPHGQREDRLLDHVLATVATVLGDEAGEVEPDQGFFELGMDSVMAVSLKARLERSLGVELPATLTFELPTTRALARHLLSTVEPLPVPEPLPGPEPEPAADPPADDDDDVLHRLVAALAEEG